MRTTLEWIDAELAMLREWVATLEADRRVLRSIGAQKAEPPVAKPVPDAAPAALTHGPTRRGRPPRAAKTNGGTQRAARRATGGPSIADRVLAVVSESEPAGVARPDIVRGLSGVARPNHIGLAVARLLRGKGLEERDGRLHVAA